MRKCPNCQAENMDEAGTCFLCGQGLKKKGRLTRLFGASGPKRSEAQEGRHPGPEIETQARGQHESEAPEESVFESPERNAEYLKDEARQQLSQRQYERAVEACDQAIAINPDYADAYYNRGLAYIRLTEYQNAIEDFDQVVRLSPDDIDARINLGMAQLMACHPAQALDTYDEIVKLDHENAAGYNGRGAAYFDQGQFEKSVQEFDTAIHLNPRLGYAYSNRAVSYIRLGRYEEAEQDVSAAAELGVDASDAIEELKKVS